MPGAVMRDSTGENFTWQRTTTSGARSNTTSACSPNLSPNFPPVGRLCLWYSAPAYGFGTFHYRRLFAYPLPCLPAQGTCVTPPRTGGLEERAGADDVGRLRMSVGR